MLNSKRFNVFYKRYAFDKRNECKNCRGGRGKGCSVCNYTGIEQQKGSEIKTLLSNDVFAMHYFPSWTPEIIANMSWDYYNMALASIPSPPDTEEDERKGMEVVDLRDMK